MGVFCDHLEEEAEEALSHISPKADGNSNTRTVVRVHKSKGVPHLSRML